MIRQYSPRIRKRKKEKGNRGKHLGWYKRAGHPKNPYNLTILNKPESYEVVNYLNDISVENPQILMTSDQAGVYRRVYTYGRERIAERDLVSVEGVPNDPLYYLYDGHNSVTQLINPAGQVRDKYRYDPFGTPLPGGKLSPNTRLFNNPYGYNGEAHDIDSGLQYLRARYYDPAQGRFLTRDSYLGSIMQPLSLNRYIYTENNPVMYSDPSGHIFMLATAAIGAVLGGAYGAYTSYKETGKVDWREVGKDAAIGGVAGLAGGAGAAYWLAGSAAASLGTVATGAMVKAAATVAEAVVVYNTVKYATTSIEAAKTVTYNTAVTYGPAAVTETLNLATWFGGDVKKYGQYKAAEIAFAKIGGPLGAQLSRLIKTKTKACGDVPSIGKQQLVNLPSGVIEGAGKGLSGVSPSIRNAFGSDAKITTLTKDTTVYRYYGGDSKASSNWFTPNKVDNPASELALPPGNKANLVDTVVLPKGTRVIEGTVAPQPQWGQPGGGYQYYVLP